MVVPTVNAPMLTVMMTGAVLLVTVLPKASLIVMTGWVVNAEPLALPAARVERVAWVAVLATTLTTCTGLPLLIVFVVTTAVRLPRDGVLLKVTINWVAVALVTVPVPLLKATVLLAAMVSNPVPSMVKVVAVTSRSLVFTVTEGATVAVCPVKAMLFQSTLAFPEMKFAVVISSLPSPFRSPKATAIGPSPAAKVA